MYVSAVEMFPLPKWSRFIHSLRKSWAQLLKVEDDAVLKALSFDEMCQCDFRKN